jgi:hypothetical protein
LVTRQNKLNSLVSIFRVQFRIRKTECGPHLLPTAVVTAFGKVSHYCLPLRDLFGMKQMDVPREGDLKWGGFALARVKVTFDVT